VSSPTSHPMPSPERVFQSLNAYQLTEALRGAIELDLFTAIGDGNHTAAAIAGRIKGTERGARILCDFLTVAGFLEKRDGRYRLAADAAMFLDRRSPAYLGTTAQFLGGLRGYFSDVAGLVRKGGTLSPQHGTLEPDNPAWVDFARSMAALSALPSGLMADILAPGLPQSGRVLDIAAGHGLFGIAIAQKHATAQITALDWAKVLEVAGENARGRGVAERLHQLPGSAFTTEFGGGYDLVLLTNFLHHFDLPTNESLLRKVRAALKAGGRVATLEFVVNPDRVSPPAAANFSLMMLGTTEAGDAYTFAELDQMFRNAGFGRSERRSLEPSPETLIVSYA
jgi:ubiquinone/menaquinone biosynthesis C-methylase UbiE